MIHYLTGDATDPQVPGYKIVAHVVNDIGAWGRGFVLSLSKKWPEAEAVYRRWYQEQDRTNCGELTVNVPLELGQTVMVMVDNPETKHDRTWVAHMVGQTGIFAKNGVPPIRYAALRKCLAYVAEHARFNARFGPSSVHMPRIGCGLAGGSWLMVEEIINEVMSDIDVYVYDFNSGDARTIP